MQASGLLRDCCCSDSFPLLIRCARARPAQNVHQPIVHSNRPDASAEIKMIPGHVRTDVFTKQLCVAGVAIQCRTAGSPE